MRSAARLIGVRPKFGHASRYMPDVLHRLPAEQRVSYRVAWFVWRRLLGLATVYLRDLVCPLLSGLNLRSLRSSHQGLILAPFARTSTKQRAAHSPWWSLRPEMGSLLNFVFFLEPCHLPLKITHFSCAAVGSFWSSYLEEAEY